MKQITYAVVGMLIWVWMLGWTLCSELDQAHCEEHGMEYDYTSIGFKGYCGDGVPAETVGR